MSLSNCLYSPSVERRPDNVFLTMPLLFLHLSDSNIECSLAIGHLLQAVPEDYTSGKPIPLKYFTRVGITLTNRAHYIL